MSLPLTSSPLTARRPGTTTHVALPASAEVGLRSGLTILAAALVLPVWVMTPWDFEKFGLPKFQVLVLLGVSAALLLLAHGLAEGSFGIRPSLTAVAVALLAFQTVIASFMSDDMVASVTGSTGRHDGAVTVLVNAALFFLAYRVASARRSDSEVFVRVIAVASVPVAAYAWAQALGLDPFVWEPTRHGVFSTMGNQVFLGAVAGMGFAASLGLALFAARGWLWLLLAGFDLAVLVLAPSWAGMACATVTLGAAVLLAVRRGEARRAVTALGATAAVVIIALAPVVMHHSRSTSENIRPFVLESLDTVAAETAASWRLALAAAKDRPLTGIGPERLGSLNDRYGGGGVGGADTAVIIDEPYGVPFEWLVETGYPGAVLYAVILGSVLAVVLRALIGGSDRPTTLLSLILASLTAVSLLTIVPIGLEAVWWILVGLLVGGRCARPTTDWVAAPVGGRRQERGDPARLPSSTIRQEGFTLIELLVVIIIIAILAAIAIPTYLGTRTKAQDAAAITLVRNALTVVESANIDKHNYTLVTAADLQSVEPAMTYNILGVDLVDPNVPTVNLAVVSLASNRAVDYYGQGPDTFDIACVSESGNRYGIQVHATGAATTDYVKVKVVEGNSSLGW